MPSHSMMKVTVPVHSAKYLNYCETLGVPNDHDLATQPYAN